MNKPTWVRHQAVAVITAGLMAGGTMLATSASATVSDVSAADQQTIVNETNKVRQAADAPPLAWDDSVAKDAQAWADNPDSTPSGPGSLKHSPSFNGAENMSTVGPAGATAQWAAEKSKYDADPNKDPNSQGYKTQWGHYWNMIQSRFTKIGCGAREGVTVCHYKP
ncbi:CAP domain-containing protein [Streptomyces sp. 5-8]|uniref:CAP domain-containing protein n=1 Tax=Streptomyces musisoli TaxID=2802280 RepID=A0ABS1PCT2_9ACTN|nr:MULTISPECIES: CAP domain-containing protein [Streptomyces]MBL1109980.1 CAP domain-containing protein [Streptomyces musisoli]MBY8841399.1 CAP domain-containing protein [Streptomyces sp. SP2-10]